MYSNIISNLCSNNTAVLFNLRLLPLVLISLSSKLAEKVTFLVLTLDDLARQCRFGQFRHPETNLLTIFKFRLAKCLVAYPSQDRIYVAYAFQLG
jgi:hypothetical protein